MSGQRDDIPKASLATLRTLSGRSLQRAGESLTSLLRHPVRLAVAEISTVPMATLPTLVAAADGGVMAGLRFQIVGDTGGQIIILFPLRTIFRMLRSLLGAQEEPRSLSDRERSAVGEVGNILASSFLSALGDALRKRLMPTPPEIHLDDLSGLMGRVMADLEGQVSEVLVVRALFQDPEQRIEGHFFVLPEMASLEAMVHEAGLGGGATE